MITFLRRLYPLLDRATKIRLIIACSGMLFLSLLEALAFVALIPLMQLLTAPNMQTTSSSVTFASDLFGNPSPQQLALMLAVITVGVYIVKSFAAIGIIRWATTFALAEETVVPTSVTGACEGEDACDAIGPGAPGTAMSSWLSWLSWLF